MHVCIYFCVYLNITPKSAPVSILLGHPIECCSNRALLPTSNIP